MSTCGYCGASSPAGDDPALSQVHEITCPFVPEAERRVRAKLAELEDRVARLEDRRPGLDPVHRCSYNPTDDWAADSKDQVLHL